MLTLPCRLWLINSVSKPARVWAGEGELKAKVLPHCSHLHRPYTPAPLALNTHVQNVLGFIRGATIHAQYTRQLIIAHDGRFISTRSVPGLGWRVEWHANYATMHSICNDMLSVLAVGHCHCALFNCCHLCAYHGSAWHVLHITACAAS
jgi:hypothetical protein